MTLYSKVKWTLGILSIFFIILATNLIDRKNFSIIKNSVETIYTDRLVAKNILFKLSKLVSQKKVIFKYERSQFEEKTSLINARIRELLEVFATTELTTREKIVFDQLQNNLASLKQLERRLIEGELSDQQFDDQLIAIEKNLDDLSEIQLEEGRRELFESKKAIESIDLFTQLEVYFLIFIAIIIQIVVMYNPQPAKDP